MIVLAEQQLRELGNRCSYERFGELLDSHDFSSMREGAVLFVAHSTFKCITVYCSTTSERNF